MWGEDSERGLCLYLASGGLPGICSTSSYFTHSPYMTGTLPAVAIVLNLRMGGFVYVLRLCGPFKWNFLKIWQFLLPSQSPLLFIARSYGDLSSRHWNPGLCGLAWGWDCWLPRYPSRFLSTICECGTVPHSATTSSLWPFCLCASPPASATLPLLPIWMSVASLNPWLSDFHTAQFSDSSGCYLF